MKTVCEKDKCNGCKVCLDICPKGCITIDDNIDKINAEIKEDLCINCKLCKRVCPNITKVKKQKPIMCKHGWADCKIRDESSSGGAASAIIRSFIQSGGYVASCIFEKGDFVFIITNKLDELEKFAGSKYVKSNPIGIYKKIEERLKSEKVLL